MDKKSLIRSLSEKGFSEKIVDAFAKVNREDFVPEEMKKYAYADDALPIGSGQTISQPYTIAFMLSLLELEDKQKILEVGSGSGYVLALLSEISLNSKIFGIERMEKLAKSSKDVLSNARNIRVIYDNGYAGLPYESPFDRILVSASGNEIPKELVNQLREGGILVMPVGDSIIKLRKSNKVVIEEYPGFVFVPLVKD